MPSLAFRPIMRPDMTKARWWNTEPSASPPALPSGPPFAEDLTRIGARLQALDGQLVGDNQL
ncbi:hypothetical protein B8W85_11810 [Lentilactobacillus kefiri]|nr:hypothetical protein B8W85_11810 [Lentilactobacillus kefiri]